MRLLLAASLLLPLVGGCAKPALAGQPFPVIVPEDANPDVLWMLRPIVSERDGVGDVEMWGLFACYRPETPGEPECFLAKTAGAKEALVWPDDPRKYRFQP